MQPLHRLLAQGGDHIYALRQDQFHRFSQFRSEVAQIMGWLAERPAGKYAVWSQDAATLGASLFALWHHGSTAILLPKPDLPEDSASLKQALAVVSDQPLSLSRLELCCTSALPKAEEPLWGELDPEQEAVSVFTSGSSGEPKEIRKKLKHLGEEIQEIEQRFGQPDSFLVTSTVYGFHLYGLLFRLLWPLATARPFQSETLFFPEAIEDSLKQHPQQALISGPAFLKRLVDLDWPKDRFAQAQIFSSGGPLAPAVSDHWAKAFGQRPHEIFGSTETGGVAEKIHDTQPPYWECFAPVQVSADPSGCLTIESPFFAEPRFVMGDQVELLSASTFRLLGRIDRIVKIEEKRVNLVEMEHKLMELGSVELAVLIETERIWPDKARKGLVAIIALNQPLPSDRAAQRQLSQSLKTHLSATFAAVTIPKKWRYYTDIPLGPAGKPDYTALIAELAKEPTS